MKYRTLGASGARVSELCLGAMTFGEADEKSMMHKVGTPEDDALKLMSRALDAGVNFWDTADVYGQDGLSERVIGRWLKETGRRREVVIATKCRFGMGPGPNDRGASRLHIKRALEDSLRRLGTDVVDLYQIHMQDALTPEDEVVAALDELVREGKIHYFGASNYAAYRLVESLWAADKRAQSRFVTLQAQYNLIERSLEMEHIPALRRWGLGLLPWSPLAGGFLSGKYQRGAAAPDGSRLGVKSDRMSTLDVPRNWDILAALMEVSREVEATPAAVALAWILRQPAVSSVIIGVRTLAQLDDNLRAADLKLPDSAVAKLTAASAPLLRYPYDVIARVDGRW